MKRACNFFDLLDKNMTNFINYKKLDIVNIKRIILFVFFTFTLINITYSQKYAKNQFVVFSYKVDIDERIKKELGAYSDKIKWVKKHFPDLFKTTILTQDKERCYMDIFVDDDIRNIERNISDNKILFSQPWNKNYSGKYKVAKNYTDLLRIVKEII